MVALENGQIAGFIFDQELARDAAYCDQSKPLQEIEDRSGLDLFPDAAADWVSEDLRADLGC